MESKLRFYSSSLESSPVFEEPSLADLEIMLADLILYSPSHPALLPVEPHNTDELERDAFQLELPASRHRSGSFSSPRKVKHIKKHLKRRGSEQREI